MDTSQPFAGDLEGESRSREVVPLLAEAYVSWNDGSSHSILQKDLSSSALP